MTDKARESLRNVLSTVEGVEAVREFVAILELPRNYHAPAVINRYDLIHEIIDSARHVSSRLKQTGTIKDHLVKELMTKGGSITAIMATIELIKRQDKTVRALGGLIDSCNRRLDTTED